MRIQCSHSPLCRCTCVCVCWLEFWAVARGASSLPAIMSEPALLNSQNSKLKQWNPSLLEGRTKQSKERRNQSFESSFCLFTHFQNNPACLNEEKPKERVKNKDSFVLWKESPGLEPVADRCSSYFLRPLLVLLDLFETKTRFKIQTCWYSWNLQTVISLQ